MHSSRMRTGRSLTVCWRLLLGGVWSGGVPGLGGGSGPGRSGLGGCLVHGVWSGEGGSGLGGGGGAWSGGVPGPGGGIPACTERHPPVDRITDACKNITLA